MMLVMLVEVLDQVKFGKSSRVTRLSERSESNGESVSWWWDKGGGRTK